MRVMPAIVAVLAAACARAETPIRIVFAGAGDGATDNRAAIAALFARTTPTIAAVPPGAYRISCGPGFTAASDLSLDFAPGAWWRFDHGCSFRGALFYWDGRKNIVVSNPRIDLNDPLVPAAPYAVIEGFASSGDADGFLVEKGEIVGGADRAFLVACGAAGGRAMRGCVIRDNRLVMTPGPLQNQCVTVTTVGGGGFVPGALVSGNRCIGSGIQGDGDGFRAIGNDISGFRFGAGIFTSGQTADPETISNRDCVISGNVMHDTVIGLDSNHTAAEGLELGCPGAVVTDNIAHDLGGAGFVNYGDDTLYRGNISYNNSKGGTYGGCPACPAGFALFVATKHLQSKNVTLIGNRAWDAAGTQSYGFAQWGVSTATLAGNDFRGAKNSGRDLFLDVPANVAVRPSETER